MIKSREKEKNKDLKVLLGSIIALQKNTNNETKRIHYETYKTDIVQDSRSLFLARFHQYI